jgi:hypothetical protein
MDMAMRSRIRMRSRIVIALVLMSNIAHADDAKQKAHEAFSRAIEAEKARDWKTAIDEFQAAYDILPSADVLYNIAVDHERLEELRDAATYYRRYLDDKPDAEDRDKVEKQIEKLKARAGEVSLDSDPEGAEVRVDGQLIGTTPMSTKLAGAHHLTIGNQAKDVTVEFGEAQKVAVTESVETGTLTVHSNVDGAQVTIDGNDAGVTPLDASVTAGAHRVVVSAPGWATYERPIEVPAQGQAQMTADLVHPIGYVAPETTTGDPHYYIAATGGYDVTGSGALGAFMWGIHRAGTDGALGYGEVYGNVAFVAEVRYHLTRGYVRPIVRLSLGLSRTSSLTAAIGVLVQPTSGHARVGFFADVGAGLARGPDANGNVLTNLVVPVTAGIQVAY